MEQHTLECKLIISFKILFILLTCLFPQNLLK